MIGPHFRIVIAHDEERKESWTFSGLGAEKRAVSLLNACTRRKTEFVTATLSRKTYSGEWETIAHTRKDS